jgi:hypothetical protein
MDGWIDGSAGVNPGAPVICDGADLFFFEALQALVMARHTPEEECCEKHEQDFGGDHIHMSLSAEV